MAGVDTVIGRGYIDTKNLFVYGCSGIVIACGAQYRRPNLARRGEFKGTGVYYGATLMESQLCDDEEVVIVDGGNSAGQAAVFSRADLPVRERAR